MKKFSVVIIAVLLGITGSLLFYQWKGYSEQREEQIGIEVKQEVSLVHKNGRFYVDQWFKNMQAGTYKIGFPSGATGNECRRDEDKECEWTIKGRTLTVKNPSDIQFSYQIPSPSEAGNSFLLDRWLITLDQIRIQETKIQLTEKEWRGGTWAGAVDVVGKSHKDLLDYYVFISDYAVPTLYWDQAKLDFSTLESGVTVYSENQAVRENLSFKTFAGSREKTIYWIISKGHAPFETESLLVTGSAEEGKSALQRKLIMNELRDTYLSPENEQWQLDIVASAALKTPVGSAKAKSMYGILSKEIDEEQLGAWLKELKDKEGKKVGSKELDNLLNKASGYKTDFFTVNKDKDGPVLPLVFYDNRDIYLNEVKVQDISIVYMEEKPFVTLAPLLKHLGYTTAYKDGAIDAVKNAIHYQFFPGKQLFVLNQTKYGLQTVPVTIMNGRAFIDLSLVNTFFNVPAVETEEAVTIISPVSEKQ